MVKNWFALIEKKKYFYCESHVIEYASVFFIMFT